MNPDFPYAASDRFVPWSSGTRHPVAWRALTNVAEEFATCRFRVKTAIVDLCNTERTLSMRHYHHHHSLHHHHHHHHHHHTSYFKSGEVYANIPTILAHRPGGFQQLAKDPNVCGRLDFVTDRNPEWYNKLFLSAVTDMLIQ